ncbi:uncharacterized protein [Watersipora subatra]|uniref:uncharacterized protein isoform X2 n=1 Tax=Watersipora subatra TaxID=2589382 RepID=UPI00355C6948
MNLRYKSFTDLSDLQTYESCDDSSKGIAMPIDKLKVHGNQLSQQRMSLTPPQSPHPPSTSATLRRHEYIRRNMARSKPSSPEFVIEGKRVSQKFSLNPENPDGFDENKLDFDPLTYLEGRANPLKGLKTGLPSKGKTDATWVGKGASTSVVLPVLHIEGPGFSHQVRSKSSSLPADDQPAEVEDMTGEPNTTQESIWSELDNLDQKQNRPIKKNNFFTSIGPRLGDDHSELCVENSNKSNQTITLHLQTSQEKQRPITNGFTVIPNTTGSSQLPKTSKSSRDKLYKSANQLASTVGSRPLFHSVSSYINFNKRAGLYHSEKYLDSSRIDGHLKPLDNHLRRPFSKKLIAKYSDMEIQKELNDFFKIRSVK